MFNIESLNISFGLNYFYLISAAILFAVLTFITYKRTLPKTNGIKFTLLFLLRLSVLIILFFLITEPVISIAYKSTYPLKRILFIDNSASMESAIEREEFLSSINTYPKNMDIFFFDSNVYPSYSVDSISFSGSLTDFEIIEKKISEFKVKPEFITIISDGIQNSGKEYIPYDNYPFPIYTIGVGDTSSSDDVFVNSILFNSFIYKGKETSIKAEIGNKNLSDSLIEVSFFENNKLIESKSILLSNLGINYVDFAFTPQNAGNRNLKIIASSLSKEKNLLNNTKSEIINVKEEKIKIALFAGAPSQDISFIVNAIKNNQNVLSKFYIQLSSDKFTNKLDNFADSSDIIFLVGFPGKLSQSLYISKVKELLSKKIPAFVIINKETDLRKLNILKENLPFHFNGFSESFDEVQPLYEESFSALTKTENPNNFWGSLAPVFQYKSKIILKPGVNVLLNSSIRGVPIDNPLFFESLSLGNNFIVLNASGVWKWKLKSDTPEFFDSFINNIVNKLIIGDDFQNISLSINKNTFYSGEPILFKANVLDDLQNPIKAEVEIIITGTQSNFSNILSEESPGFYTTVFNNLPHGIYRYKATIRSENKVLKEFDGTFNIEKISIEQISNFRNRSYLKMISELSGGIYFDFEKLPEYFNFINNKKESDYTEITKREIFAINFDWFLYTLIILFAFEWLLRKIFGMQ